MLVGRRMEHHSGMVGLKNFVQTLFVTDGTDEHRHRDIPAVLLLQLHEQLVSAVLVDIKNEQFARLEAHHLAAQLTADGTAAAGHQHCLAGTCTAQWVLTHRSMTWFRRLPFRVGMAMMMLWMP